MNSRPTRTPLGCLSQVVQRDLPHARLPGRGCLMAAAQAAPLMGGLAQLGTHVAQTFGIAINGAWRRT